MSENEYKKVSFNNSMAELEVTKAQLKTLNTVIDNYTNPAVRSILETIKLVAPSIGALLDSSFDRVFRQKQKNKMNQLVDMILINDHAITSEMVNDVEFIVNFTRVLEAVSRLANNDKIQHFANLIRNGYLTDNESKISNDEFEEYFYEITMLSFRELEYLAFMWKFAENYDGKIPSYQWKNFTDRFKEKFSGQDPNHICRKLTKTGLLYEIKMGSYPSTAFIEYHLDNEGYAFDKDFRRFYEVVLDSD